MLKKSPNFARTVDIHRKPGYDPVELFVDPKTNSIPLFPPLIKGSHGRPADPITEEGLALYISSKKSNLLKNSSETVISLCKPWSASNKFRLMNLTS